MQYVVSIPAILVAFTVTVSFMFALRPLAGVLGLVDRPGGRKFHIGEVPIVGGVAMFIGISVALTLLPSVGGLVLSLLVSSFLILAVGVLDDRFVLAPSIRLATQISAILIVYYGSSIQLLDIGDPFGFGRIATGPFALPMTVLVALTVINAYNLIDGADGLAGSLAIIALLSVSFVGGYNHPTTAIALTVCGAVAGFLVFNFPIKWNRHIRSFMGDAGSTLVGFTILWVTIGASQGEARVVSPVIALWFASVPIYDLLTCFVKRLRAGKSPFTPGRDHFHHVLNRGTSQARRTMVVLTAMQLVYACVGLAGHFLGAPDVLMFAGWSILGLTQFAIIRKIAAYKRLARLQRNRRRSLAAVR